LPQVVVCGFLTSLNC